MLSKKDKKMMILSIIKEKKELLFGNTSSTLTNKADKMNEWQNIYFKCLALGLVREGKDYTYVRDVFWQNLKRTALAKVDNSGKTGNAGGRVSVLNSIDNLVLEIIYNKSPSINYQSQIDCLSVDGVEVLQTSSFEDKCTVEVIAIEPGISGDDFGSTTTPSTLGLTSSVPTLKRKAKHWNAMNSEAFKDHKEELLLKRKKLKLEVENLEITNYKLRAELYVIEKQAGLKTSQFTEFFEDIM